MYWRVLSLVVAFCGLFYVDASSRAEEAVPEKPAAPPVYRAVVTPAQNDTGPPVPLDPPQGEHFKQLGKEEIWLDTKRKQVLVNGRVSLREGSLEMFACPRGTKEHEAIVGVNAKAYMVHAALLAVGAIEGSTVKFEPVYTSATGPVVQVSVMWKDKDGKLQEAAAQHWIRDTRTRKEMTQNWVFAGSRFWVDERTGQKHYMADGGDLICVSNFNTATLDIPVESSQKDDSRSFEAFTEHIPPVNTPIRLVLAPELPPKAGEKPVEKGTPSAPGRAEK